MSPSLARFAHSVRASSIVLRPAGGAGAASALASFDVPAADGAAFGGGSSRRLQRRALARGSRGVRKLIGLLLVLATIAVGCGSGHRPSAVTIGAVYPTTGSQGQGG